MEEITIQQQIEYIELDIKVSKELGLEDPTFLDDITILEAILKTLQKVRQKELLIELMNDENGE